jgi:ferric-dicitrate binding protein FerR (iron transport regulator)
MTVSGVFPLDEPDALLQALTRALDLQIVELDQSTLQLLKAAN